MTSPQTLPHDIAAEKAVIGSLLLDPNCYHVVSERLDSAAFHVPIARDAFNAIQQMAGENRSFDALVVAEQIQQAGKSDERTIPWLMEALNETPHSGHVAHYAEVVADRYSRRRLALLATDIGELSRDPMKPVTDTLRLIGDRMVEASRLTPNAWGEVVQFDRIDLPVFPVESLPVVLRDWVQAVSLSTQTPPDLAALLGLAVCAAGIARRVEVELAPGYREPTNLFVAVELPPANRKSAVFAEATAPLRKLEREEAQQAAPDLARAASERRRLELRLKKLEKQVGEGGDAAAAAEADDIAGQLSAMPEPVAPRRIIDEATPEFVGRALADQGGRIACMSAEGGVFDLLAGMYSKSGAPNLNTFLMGHAGDDLRIDRLCRPSIHVERPALTCAFAVQPAVIQSLSGNAVFRGRGLVGRFALASPSSWLGHRDINPPPVPDAVREAYRNVVQCLARIDGQYVLTLTSDANDDRLAWAGIVESMFQEGHELESVQDWGGKLVGLTARLAAVMHCAERGGPVGEISQQTYQSAVEMARYLIPHAQWVLRRLTADGQADRDAEYVLRWIVRHGHRSFTKRDLYQQTKSRFRKVESLAPALAELVARSYIRSVRGQSGGRGRPSEAYEVNPAVFETPEQRPRNPRNWIIGDSGGAPVGLRIANPLERRPPLTTNGRAA